MPAVGATSVNLHQPTRDQAERNVESKRAHRQGRVEGHWFEKANDHASGAVPPRRVRARRRRLPHHGLHRGRGRGLERKMLPLGGAVSED